MNKNTKILVSITTQNKYNGKWLTENTRQETWSLDGVNEYFSEKNIKAWKNASVQRLERGYTDLGYLPTRYTNTQKPYKNHRIVYELDYKIFNR